MTTTPTRYRKKPVEIEAMQWPGGAKAATAVIDWVLASGGTATYREEQDFRNTGAGILLPECIAIRTLEGRIEASPGDYVIRGVQGEFYPCKPDIFAATYDATEQRPNVPATPARVSTPADLDALPVGSVVRGDDGHPWEKVYATFTTRAVWHNVRSYGDYESTVAGLLPATLLHVPGRDLLAEARAEAVMEAEARGYERGKRDALTEAADAWGDDVLVPVTARYVRDSLLRRAAETPGGAA